MNRACAGSRKRQEGENMKKRITTIAAALALLTLTAAPAATAGDLFLVREAACSCDKATAT